MTTHLRARALQAGAFLALIGGVLAAAPSPALAIAPAVRIDGLSSGDLPSGGKATLKYTISNRNLATPGAEAEPVNVVINANGMSCSGQCNFDDSIEPGKSKSFTATLTAPNVDDGQTKNIQVQINAKIGNDGGSATRDITVRGQDKPKTVRQVSGKVKDQEGKPVPGANVGLLDSKGHSYNALTNGDGGYSFTSSDSNPISTGSLTIGAAKQGYKTITAKANGGDGKTLNVPLILTSTTPTSTSPSPSTSVSSSPTPTEEVSEEATEGAGEESAAPLDAAPTSGEDEGSGSTLFIILGGLLVAAGIGAIVLVLMRRKANEDPDDPDGPGPGGPVTPSRGGAFAGGLDETRMAAPVGGRGSDATMIAPRSGAPSMADAPTMITHVPPVAPVDEFPDPYGAPMPQNGGYNAPGGWGTAAASGGAAAAGAYGAANQYDDNAYGAAPAQADGYPDQDDNAYGAAGYNGYDQPAYGEQGYVPEQPAQRYDEPTGMWKPEADGGYPPDPGYADQGEYPPAEPVYGQGRGVPQQSGAYQGGGTYGGPAAQGGYGQDQAADQADGYGQWDGPGGGIDSGNAYGPANDGGTYGGAAGGTPAYGGAAPAAPAYGGAAPAGGQAYGGGSYGAPAAPAGGYDDDQAGYDPRATYGRPADGYEGPGRAQPPAPRGGGYPDQGGYAGGDQGGYYGGDQQQPPPQGGRHGGQPRQQPPDQNQPGQRRPLDWLDD